MLQDTLFLGGQHCRYTNCRFRRLLFFGREIQMQEEGLSSLWSCTGKLQSEQQTSWHTHVVLKVAAALV